MVQSGWFGEHWWTHGENKCAPPSILVQSNGQSHVSSWLSVDSHLDSTHLIGRFASTSKWIQQPSRWGSLVPTIRMSGSLILASDKRCQWCAHHGMDGRSGCPLAWGFLCKVRQQRTTNEACDWMQCSAVVLVADVGGVGWWLSWDPSPPFVA